MDSSLRLKMMPAIFATVCLYSGIALAISSRYFEQTIFPPAVLDVIAGVLIVGGFFFMMLAPGTPFRRYFITLLGVRPDSDRSNIDLAMELRGLLNEVRKLRSSVTPETAKLSKVVQTEILELYRAALSERFADNISSEIKLLVSQSFKTEIESEATKYLSEVNSRLQSASSTVSARGFLNLVLGIAFAAGALYMLQEAIWLLTPDRLNTLPISTVIYLTATRVSLAVVITFVSYFFLSLYKRSLEDAKFYQNEMTDISSRATALQLAYYLGDKDSRGYVLAKLMESDRNRALTSSPAEGDTGNFGAEIAKRLLDKLPTIKAE